MALKDIWKDKVNGENYILAEDINAIAQEAIRLDEDKVDKIEGKGLSSNDFTDADKKKLDELTNLEDIEALNELFESVKYYEDPFAEPSDPLLFNFTTDDETMTASVSIKYNDLYNQGINEIVVPYEYVNGDKTYLVTNIENDSAQTNRSGVTKIIIPNTIKSIGEDVFSECINLKTFNMPDSVTIIGKNIFKGCSKLTDIILSQNISEIPPYAFCGCEMLTRIIIHYGVTSIGRVAFHSCKQLKEMIIPCSVKSIGDEVFVYCSNLNKVIIPEGITEIAAYNFYECEQIKEITIPKSVKQFGPWVFVDKNNKNINLTIYCYKNSAAEEFAIRNKILYRIIDNNIVTATSTTIKLTNQQELRLGTLEGKYSLYIPTPILNTYESYLCFTTGTTFSLSYTSSPIIWKGDDVDNEGDFVPNTNTMYEIKFKKINERTLEDGTIEPVIVARVSVI